MTSLIVARPSLRKSKKLNRKLIHRDLANETQRLQVQKLLAAFRLSPETAAMIASAAFGEARS